jgi:hypothetical protein
VEVGPAEESRRDLNVQAAAGSDQFLVAMTFRATQIDEVDA